MGPRNDARRTNNAFAEQSTTGYRRERAATNFFKFEVQQIRTSSNRTSGSFRLIQIDEIRCFPGLGLVASRGNRL
jgi:hypothetical protein